MTSAVVYVSPSILACPAMGGCKSGFREELEEYILQLSRLRDSIGSKLFQVLISQGVGDLLIEAGCYPIFPSVRDGLVDAGLDDIYQVGDVVKVVEQILREAESIEDIVGVLDILADPVNIEGSVKYVGDGCIVDRQNQNKVILALGVHLGVIPENSVWVVAQRVNKDASGLRVRATIVDVDWSRESPSLFLPVSIDKRLNFGGSFDQVLLNFDVAAAIATFPLGIMEEIISCALVQAAYPEGGGEKVDWIIGPEFEKSIFDLHLHNNPPVFRALVLACVNVIRDVALDKVHTLRTGAGGNNPQVVSGNSSAWRRDINYEFHLHYWTNGRRCEFASCVVHEDFTIPPPK